MANICTNRFYCSTDNDRNMEKIIYFLDENFGFTELDGEKNRIHGEFDSRWIFPEEEIKKLMSELEDDPSLSIEIISFEPGMDYLEAHILYNGEWRIFP